MSIKLQNLINAKVSQANSLPLTNVANKPLPGDINTSHTATNISSKSIQLPDSYWNHQLADASNKNIATDAPRNPPIRSVDWKQANSR